MKAMFAGVVATFALVLVLGSTGAGEKDKKDEKPKYKISEVMKKAMAGKGSLVNKVGSGTATDEEKQQLVDMFVALHGNVPPKGDRSAWEKATTSLVDAAKAAQKDEKAAAALPKIVNCGNCHKEFKGK